MVEVLAVQRDRVEHPENIQNSSAAHSDELLLFERLPESKCHRKGLFRLGGHEVYMRQLIQLVEGTCLTRDHDVDVETPSPVLHCRLQEPLSRIECPVVIRADAGEIKNQIQPSLTIREERGQHLFAAVVRTRKISADCGGVFRIPFLEKVSGTFLKFLGLG